MKQAKWIRWAHRWVGLWFSVVALMASASGLIHLWMSHTQPPPPTGSPISAAALDLSVVKITPHQAVAAVEAATSTSRVSEIQLLTIAGTPWYQLFLVESSMPKYVCATTGHYDPERDEKYAQEIAGRALGHKNCRKAQYLTAFDRDYIPIFRILPVYRFDADDEAGSRVYVSTVTGNVTRATDNQKQWEATVFSVFHKWMFLRDKNVRNYSLGLATLGIFLASVLGIWLFWVTRRKKYDRMRVEP